MSLSNALHCFLPHASRPAHPASSQAHTRPSVTTSDVTPPSLLPLPSLPPVTHSPSIMSLSGLTWCVPTPHTCNPQPVQMSFFGVGAPEALLVGVVALVVFGPKGLAEVRAAAAVCLCVLTGVGRPWGLLLVGVVVFGPRGLAEVRAMLVVCLCISGRWACLGRRLWDGGVGNGPGPHRLGRGRGKGGDGSTRRIQRLL